jgi:chromate transport protein ChrA
MQDNASDHVLSWIGNGASGVAIVTTIFGWLPPAAALIAFVWYIIQIYESATVQKWIRSKRIRKIARMKAQVLLMEAQNKGDLPGLDD